MDAAGTLALVVLGILIGWVVSLIVDFLILRPHWIAQGRQQASTVPDEELRVALREQTATLARLEALREAENAAVARLNAHLAEIAAKPTLSDAEIKETLAQFIDTLQGQQDVLQRTETATSQGAKSIDALGAQLYGLQDALVDRLRAAMADEAVPHDRLTDIKGIGPAFAGRLHEMGIHSFRQIAALTPEELAAMMNVRGRPKIDAESWIEQARLYVSGRAKTGELS